MLKLQLLRHCPYFISLAVRYNMKVSRISILAQLQFSFNHSTTFLFYHIPLNFNLLTEVLDSIDLEKVYSVN